LRTWAFPIGFTVAATILGALILKPTLAASLAGFDPWPWVERLSWLFTVVGVAVALVVGLPQLRVIREQLARPRFLVGFDEPYAGEPGSGVRGVGRIRPTWGNLSGGTAEVSEHVEIGITIVNIGEKTASDVLCNFVFPSAVYQAEALVLGAPRPQRDGDGSHRVVMSFGTLNPKGSLSN